MRTESIRANVDVRSFDQLFEAHLASQSTYKSAYEEAEKEHIKLYGHRRYADHESYRVSRSRRFKKRK